MEGIFIIVIDSMIFMVSCHSSRTKLRLKTNITLHFAKANNHGKFLFARHVLHYYTSPNIFIATVRIFEWDYIELIKKSYLMAIFSYR